jgi:TonB family protein
MKIVLRWSFVFFFLLTFHVHVSFSQNEKITHTYKIIGNTRGPFVSGSPKEIGVEYDPYSTNHLFIIDYGTDGVMKSKKQYLFSGKEFFLSRYFDYSIRRELCFDGVNTWYREDGSIENQQVFVNGRVQREATFYPDGSKQLSYSIENKVLNGEYQMWHPNGNLKYSGNYKASRKDGEFQEFNDSGELVKTGIYKEGKLVSGDPVVQDITYDQPEKQAVYITGDEGFDEFLKKSSLNVDKLKEITRPRRIDLQVLIDKSGQITNIEFISEIQPNELEILNEVFKELPVFTPATEEGIPVISLKNLNFILSAEGLKRNINDEVFVEPDEMPEFPGGSDALRQFIASNLHYPYAAQKDGIQGKVFVSFVVNQDGSISNILVSKGVHNLLDEEAVRVIKSMPRWIPGILNGKPIKVSYTVPINFAFR